MFDRAKLDALRAKYVGAKETEVAPERFRKPLGLVFGDAYRRAMPYAGVSTLLDMPYRPEAPDLPDFAGLDVALVGVPMDLGVTNRAGARFGPRAVRAVERIGPYNHALDVTPKGECAAADIGDVPLRSRFSLDQSIEDIAAFYARIHAAGVRPVSVGGDHSVSYPILKSLGAGRPLGLVHIDAHCDTMGEVDGSKFHHGGPFRQAVLAGALDPERTIQIGIRGPAEIFWGFSYEFGDDRLAHRGCRPARHRRASSRRRAPSSATGRPISRSMSTGSTRPMPPAPAPPKRAASPRARRRRSCAGSRASTSSAATWSRSPRNTTPTSNTAMVGAQMLFEIFSLLVLGPTFKRRA